LFTDGIFYDLNTYAFQVETDSYGLSLGKNNDDRFRLRALNFTDLSTTSIVFNTSPVKMVVAAKTNDAVAVVNGTISGTSTANPTIITVPTALSIGARTGGSGQYSGHISRLTYYPQRLPNATLQALTL
jgi:hypothetical protein